MIEFRNVNKTYDTGTEAVHNANFKIDKGEFAFLVGSSGSGKSTLIKLILKSNSPAESEIFPAFPPFFINISPDTVNIK